MVCDAGIFGTGRICQGINWEYGCQENIKDCKIPLYERMRKQDGVWYPETKVLFSGYLFVKTANVMKLYEQLKARINL